MATPLRGTEGSYKWLIAITGTFVVVGAIGFARFGYTLILPRMISTLKLSETQAGGIATANMLGYLPFSLIGGILATRFGARIVITCSLCLAAVALFCTGLSENFATAAMWRFLAGAGGGGANVPIMGLMSTWFSEEKRGLASGIVVSGSSVALLISGLIIPPILSSGPPEAWRNGWYMLGSITLVIAVLAVVMLRNKPGTEGKKERVSPPAKKVFWSRSLGVLIALYVLFGFSYVIFATFFAGFLVSEVGLSEQKAGALWSLIGGISIASGFFWGYVSDRFGRRIAFVGIFLIQSLAYLIFALSGSIPGYTVGSLLFSITAFSIPAVMGATVGDLYGARAAPAIFGFVTLTFGIGQALGPAAAGGLADLTGSYKPAFVLAAVAAFCGAPLAFLLRRSKKS